MKCTDCGSVKVITYDTRRIEDKVVRKRRCTACDTRFYTLEQYMSEDELEEIQEIRRKANGKVLYELSNTARHDGGHHAQGVQDSPMGVPVLSGEEELESLREGGI